MKTLTLIILILLVGCQKQEYYKIQYKIQSIGGSTEIVFNNNTVHSAGYDTTFILPVINHKYGLEFRVKHYTNAGETSEVKVEIFVNDRLEFDRLIEHRGCKNGNYLIKFRI